jgi:Leucine-rich repeat (LRR) protein
MLKKLKCSNNELRSLPDLPDNLEVLEAASNHISDLPTIPSSLRTLNIKFNDLDDDYDKNYSESMGDYIDRIINLQNNPPEIEVSVNNI